MRRAVLPVLLVLGAAAGPAFAVAPESQITGGPTTLRSQNEAYQQPFTFSSPSGDASWFECRVDGGPWTQCSGGNSGQFTVQTTADGTHTFEARGVKNGPDGLEVDDTPASRTFTVAIPPDTQMMGGGQTGPNSVTFAFGASPAEPGVRFECSLDSGAWSGCASPVSFTNLAPGGHSFAVRAIDAANNADPSPTVINFTAYAPPAQPPMPTPYPPGVYPPGISPPSVRPVGRTPVRRPGRVVRSTGVSILSGPGIAADGIEARVLSRVGGTLKMVVTPKGMPDTVIASGEQKLPSLSGRGRSVGDSSGTTIRAPFTPEGKLLVAKSPRLPVDVTLSFTADGAREAVDEDKSLTLLQKPVFSKGPGGRKHAGRFGVERIRGTAGGDVLGGASGNDRIMGLGGNDRLTGGTGNDTPMGGPGNDSIDGDDGDDRSFGGPGDDIIIEERFGDDYLDGGPGNDWLQGGRGLDRISGGPGDDVIYGGSGVDVVDCGAGEDVVFVNLRSERQKLKGCETVQEEADIISFRCPQKGTAGPETMLGSEGNDTCHGNGGADDVEGAGGNDKLYGGSGGDRMFGRFGKDKMFGEDGDDEMEGGRDSDLLDGGAGDDQLNGGYGDDTIRGGGGNDTITARSGGRDNIDCGPGRDTVIADRKDRLKNCENVRRK